MNEWPRIPLESWSATCDTLHMYAQIVGKVHLALSPMEPQWANIPLYVSARGLTTGTIPYRDRVFQIDFDFVAHQLTIAASDGRSKTIALSDGKSVAEFYREMTAALASLDIVAHIWPMPVEVSDPVRFSEDSIHASYDRDAVARFWNVLLRVDTALKAHRAPFRRRHTLVQFFWGTFDLAYARFSGRPATPPSNDVIVRSAMDAQEICVGFWPGDKRFPEPGFWCYAFPKPVGIEKEKIAPSAAFWSAEMGEFMLRYEDVRTSADPNRTIQDFLTSTYDACARLAAWE